LAVILATKSEDNLAKIGRRMGEVKGACVPDERFRHWNGLPGRPR
jgi:hypothetical protein